MLIQIHFDGACNNKLTNPDMGIGVAVFINKEFQSELSKFVAVKGDHESSSNVAEWIGCVEAFKLLYDLCVEKFDQVEIYSDSQLITRQYNGDYEIKRENFKNRYWDAKKYAELAGKKGLKVQWIPRELNKDADKLSKIALKSLSNAISSK